MTHEIYGSEGPMPKAGANIGDIIEIENDPIRYRIIGKINNSYKVVAYDQVNMPDVPWYEEASFALNSAELKENEMYFRRFSNGKWGVKYEDSLLDDSMETYYENLTEAEKAAIEPQNIVQNLWQASFMDPDSGAPIYNSTTEFVNNTQYRFSRDNGILEVGNRHCYAMSVQDILDYLHANQMDDFENTKITSQAILEMLNGLGWMEYKVGSALIGLRDVFPEIDETSLGDLYFVGAVDFKTGTVCDTIAAAFLSEFSIRPTFVIDLSKVNWEKATEREV